jgi:hypothetical protein
MKFAISADVFGMNAEDLNYEIGDQRKLAVVSTVVGLLGGACSLLRTRLQSQFRVNRENYRE